VVSAVRAEVDCSSDPRCDFWVGIQYDILICGSDSELHVGGKPRVLDHYDLLDALQMLEAFDVIAE
jgi:hypothetical protein